jgi:hypothetical protein
VQSFASLPLADTYARNKPAAAGVDSGARAMMAATTTRNP